MNIDLKKLDELLKVLEEREISEFEFEDEKGRVHLKRGVQPVDDDAGRGRRSPMWPLRPAQASTGSAHRGRGRERGDGDFAFVTSPFVGTFYRAPSPDAQPFVDVGQHHQARSGALHRRGHEADERDRGRDRRGPSIPPPALPRSFVMAGSWENSTEKTQLQCL